jgi:hypothetical protein
MMKKVVLLIGVISSFFLLVLFCFNRTQSNNEIYSLLDEYSVAEVRHFYNCTFYSEKNKKAKHRNLKWRQNILIYLRGDYSDLDSIYVSHVIDVIDDMNLPIEVSLTNKHKDANVIMSFRNEVCDSERIVNGKVVYHTDYLDRSIISAAILISNCLSGEFRRETIEEEVFQMLGSLSDTYSVRNSKFSQTKQPKYQKILPIDIRIIELLYDPRIPYGLCRKRFENIFKSELGLDYNDLKLGEFIENNDLDSSFRNDIRNNLYQLSDSEFVKWNYEKIPVFIDSLFDQDIKASMIQEIAHINGIMDREFLVVSSERDEYGIHIILTDSEYSEIKKYNGIDALRTCTYNSELRVSGYNTEFLFDQLLEILCCQPRDIGSQYEKEALLLFAYSNILPDNYDLSKLVLE